MTNVKIYRNNTLFVKTRRSISDAKNEREQVSEMLVPWEKWITRTGTFTNTE